MNKNNIKIIHRLIYDENYQRALQLLLDIVVKQDEEIAKLKAIVERQNNG